MMHYQIWNHAAMNTKTAAIHNIHQLLLYLFLSTYSYVVRPN